MATAEMLSQEEMDENSKARGQALDAAAWAFGKAPRGVNGNPVCPWCYWEAAYAQEEDGQQESFQQHLVSAHPTALKHAYESQDFDAYAKFREVEKEREVLEDDLAAGVRVLDELDETDLLYVSKEHKEEAQRKGGTHRWVTEKKFHRFRDAGFQVEKSRAGVDMPYQHNHEDTTVRTNEMVLMFVPDDVKKKRDRIRRQRIEQQVPSHSTIDSTVTAELGEKAYKYFRAQGMPHDNAMRMSNKVEKGQAVAPDRQERGQVDFQHRR